MTKSTTSSAKLPTNLLSQWQPALALPFTQAIVLPNLANPLYNLGMASLIKNEHISQPGTTNIAPQRNNEEISAFEFMDDENICMTSPIIRVKNAARDSIELYV